jgi:AcrR family transcriptional regulator
MAKKKAEQAPALGRDAWVVAGLAALTAGGVEAVRVEVLARDLGVTKGGFYWHFTDRRELLDAIVAYWETIATVDVITAVEARGGTPAERLRRLVSLCFRGGGVDQMENALRRWGSTDPSVHPVLERVDKARLAYVADLLVAHGHSAATARDRARMLYLTMIGEFTWTSHGGPATARRTLEALCELLLTPELPAAR